MTNAKDFFAERAAKGEHATIWSKLIKGKQTFIDVSWPGRDDIKVRILVLTSTEEQLAVAGAYNRFNELKLPLTPLTVDEYNSEEVTQKLALALRDPETNELVFETADDLRDVSTVAERLVLHAEYQALAADAIPSITALSNDEFKRIDEAVKKKDETLLRSYGLNALVSYLLTTDGPQLNSPTDSSTPGE